MLPTEYRLRKRKDFNRIFDKGKYISTEICSLHYFYREDSHPSRLGFVVGRKFGKNARKSYWKRYLRECFRPLLHNIQPGYDFALIARQALTETKFRDAQGLVSSLFLKSQLIVELEEP